MRGERRCILVVEDETDLLELLTVLLESEGYDVMQAGHGQEALDQAEKRLPSLVLLDMKMPVMDGTLFARHFRQRHGDAVPIVVMTAADDARKRSAEVGAAAFLGKPFELEGLVSLVRELAG